MSGSIIGRMSPGTAILFILVSISLFISTYNRERLARYYFVSNVLNMGVFAAALVILFGYWYGAPIFYGGRIIPVAIPTAISFLLITTAQLFDKSESFFYRFFTSRAVMAQIYRPIVLISVIILMVGGRLEEVLKEHVDSALFPDVEVGSTLVLLIAIIIIVLVVSRGVDHNIVQKEGALRESEEKYRNLVDNSLAGVFRTNLKGDILYINDALVRISGFESADELMAGGILVRYKNPDDRATLIKELNEKGSVSNFEVELLTKTGETRNFTLNGVLEGDVISGMLIDITERRQAEKASEIAEQNFQNSLDDSPLGIRIITGDGELIYANKAILSIYGYSSVEELETTPTQQRYTPESYAEHQKRSALRKLGKPVPSDYEISIVRKDGGIKNLSVSRKEVSWNGKVQFQTVYQDITKRKQAEEKLRESEEKFRNLADNAPIGITLSSFAGAIIDVNKALLEMYGYASKEEFNNVPVSARFYDLNDRIRWLKLVREQGKVDGFEVRLKRKDGTLFWASFNTLPQAEQSGERRFINVVQDITERKEAKLKLVQAAEEWQTTFDSITDMISVQDEDHRIVMVNKAWVDTFKMPPKDAKGKYCYEIVHGTASSPPNCPLERTFKTGNTEFIEMFEPLLDRWLQISTSPILGKNGGITGVVHSIRDVSTGKKMQEQLMAQDRLASIGQLTSGIAHELNNPLTSVVGFSELLLQKEDIPDDVKSDLKVINDGALRTARIVRNLLAFARKTPEEKIPLDITDSIRAVLELRAYEHKASNIKVTTRFASALSRVSGNSFQLQQVFLNIIMNAEYFMLETHQKGNLIITTERIGDFVRVSFADDGPGISGMTIKNLFTPFFTTKPIGKGTGLGLSICHGIIAEHGGIIYVESEPGKGATFIVELPVEDTTIKMDAIGS